MLMLMLGAYHRPLDGHCFKITIPESPSTVSDIFKEQIFYIMAVGKTKLRNLMGQNMIYIKTEDIRKGMKICFCIVGGS